MPMIHVLGLETCPQCDKAYERLKDLGVMVIKDDFDQYTAELKDSQDHRHQDLRNAIMGELQFNNQKFPIFVLTPEYRVTSEFSEVEEWQDRGLL